MKHHNLFFVFTLSLLFNFALAQQSKPSSYKLIVNLENAPFDSLYLHDYTEGRHILIPGENTGKFSWEIRVPDSIVENSEAMELAVKKFDPLTNCSRMVRFITENNGAKTIVWNVGIEDRINYLHGKYLGQTSLENEKIRVPVGDSGTETLKTGELIIEDFKLLIKDVKSDIAVRAEDPFFSWFNKGRTYENQLSSYLKVAEKYPDSRFLMTHLALNLSQYKSKDDIKRMYETLSAKHKNTFWAKKIERYLSKKFENTLLINLDNAKQEYVVEDSSRYNLLLFTASWCVNCIEEIPLLKTIYSDLGKDLVFTYVSIDNTRGVIPYKSLVKSKNIPWRSLLAYEDVKKVKQQYFIEGIPLNLLVNPNGEMEQIDLRKEADRLKLYSLIKSRSKDR